MRSSALFNRAKRFYSSVDKKTRQEGRKRSIGTEGNLITFTNKEKNFGKQGRGFSNVERKSDFFFTGLNRFVHEEMHTSHSAEECGWESRTNLIRRQDCLVHQQLVLQGAKKKNE